MIFTRQSPKTKEISFINQKVCLTKSVNCSLSSARESCGRQFTKSKDQPSCAVHLCSLLSLPCKQHPPVWDQSCYNTAARIWLWHCPHQNALCSARTTGSSRTTDQGAIGKVEGDTFITTTAYYNKQYWKKSYAPFIHAVSPSLASTTFTK